MPEAKIVINGRELTETEAMTVRIALTCMNYDCGDGEHGRHMSQLYKNAVASILHTILNG